MLFEFIEGLLETVAGCLQQFGLVCFVAVEYARPGQQFERVDGCGVAQLLADLLAGPHQGLQQWLIEGDVLGLFGGRVKAQGALDLAPGQLLAQALTQGTFQFPEGFGQAQAGFQITVVDRADFPDQGTLVRGLLAASKGGHAVHHRATPANDG